MKARWPSISQTEMEVLGVLWDEGPGTVREIDTVLRRQGRHWAYTTVLTLLQRLEAKDYVRSDKSAMAHVFQAAVSREGLLRRRLKDLADQLCGGVATPLMLALVEDHRFSSEDIEQFRQLLDRLERDKSKGSISKGKGQKKG